MRAKYSTYVLNADVPNMSKTNKKYVVDLGGECLCVILVLRQCYLEFSVYFRNVRVQLRIVLGECFIFSLFI